MAIHPRPIALFALFAAGLLAATLVALGPAEGTQAQVEEIDPSVAFECLIGKDGLAAILAAQRKTRTAAPDVRAQIDEIARWVEKERGAPFKIRPTPSFLTTAEVATRIQQEVRKQYPANTARLDSRLLSTLGAIPAGTDLLKTQTELLSGQIAGFYDDETSQLVVVTDDPEKALGSVEAVTLAHELQHAWADQILGLPLTKDGPPGQTDARAANLALIEGDATVTMQRYALENVSLADQLKLADSPSVRQSSTQLERYPQYLQRALVFPYLSGMELICALKKSGGWPAVDAAYRRPPRSTAQVMFPERYFNREQPADAPAPPAAGTGWTRARQVSLGAADLWFLFSAPGDQPGRALSQPKERAGRWAGGEVAQFDRADGAHAVAVSLTERPSTVRVPGLCTSMAAWYRATFPKDRAAPRQAGDTMVIDGQTQDAVLRCAATTVRLGIGPDLATARRLAGSAAR